MTPAHAPATMRIVKVRPLPGSLVESGQEHARRQTATVRQRDRAQHAVCWNVSTRARSLCHRRCRAEKLLRALSIESVTSSIAGCSRRSRWEMTLPRAHHQRAVACFPPLVMISVSSRLLGSERGCHRASLPTKARRCARSCLPNLSVWRSHRPARGARLCHITKEVTHPFECA